ncbi:MAG: glycosyltransferase family 9 protein [Ignavibacteria bacterium]|nr:glycosyltransferase family 9 protein [Ignavibacteria bacterium]
MPKQTSPYNRLKRLELRVRKWFIKTHRRGFTPVVVAHPADVLNLPAKPKILVLRQDRIGDVIVSTFILRELKTRYPDAQIDMLLSSNNVAVERIVSEYTQTRYVYRKSLTSLIELIVRMRQQHYDVVVDLMDNPSSTSGIFVTRCNARYSVGVLKENAGVYTHCVPLLDKATVHICRRVANLLMPFGIDPDRIDMTPHYSVETREQTAAQQALGIPADDTRFRLGVNISGSNDFRSYDVSKTCIVLSHIREKYPKVSMYLFAAPRHGERAAAIARSIDGLKLVKSSQSFDVFAARLHEMHALWTPDTSAVHLAAAWKTPSCVMFNQPNPSIMPWYPIGSHCEVIINKGEVLSDVPIEEVTAAIDRLFAYCGIEAG